MPRATAVPLQMGQFESGLEMDDDLGKIYLEGGGGGQVYETYELAVYFFACHTAIDCFEKRSQEGLFLHHRRREALPNGAPQHVWEHIGDALKWDIPVEQRPRGGAKALRGFPHHPNQHQPRPEP